MYVWMGPYITCPNLASVAGSGKKKKGDSKKVGVSLPSFAAWKCVFLPSAVRPFRTKPGEKK